MVLAADLDIRHLRTLVAVAEAGTFGRAAAALGYTQSAISQQVSALERVLGQPVFDRPGGPRPVELTPLGGMVLGHARTMLEQADAAVRDVDRFLAGTIGRIDIGTFQSVLTAVVPAILGRLRDERPGIDVQLVQHDDNDNLVAGLMGGGLDVGFLLEADSRVECVELFVDPFVLVARPGEVEGHAQVVTRSDAQVGESERPEARVVTESLDGIPMIAELDNLCQRQIDARLRHHSVEPDVVFRTNDNTAVTAMVRAGMGMAVMPLLAVDVDDPRLSVHRLDPPLPPRHVALAWQRDRTLSPAARLFVELALEVTAPLADRPLVPSL